MASVNFPGTCSSGGEFSFHQPSTRKDPSCPLKPAGYCSKKSSPVSKPPSQEMSLASAPKMPRSSFKMVPPSPPRCSTAPKRPARPSPPATSPITRFNSSGQAGAPPVHPVLTSWPPAPNSRAAPRLSSLDEPAWLEAEGESFTLGEVLSNDREDLSMPVNKVRYILQHGASQ